MGIHCFYWTSVWCLKWWPSNTGFTNTRWLKWTLNGTYLWIFLLLQPHPVARSYSITNVHLFFLTQSCFFFFMLVVIELVYKVILMSYRYTFSLSFLSNDLLVTELLCHFTVQGICVVFRNSHQKHPLKISNGDI